MKKYCVLTSTDKYDNNGLLIMTLTLYKDGVEHDSMSVRSGQPKYQNLRKAVDSMSGSAEPTPEGHYALGDYDSFDQPGENGINWASGVVGDFSVNWESIASPIWTGIHPASDQPMHPVAPRASMGVHLDNPAGWPGTIGCVGLQSMEDCKRWYEWNMGERVTDLYVDYGLGSVTLPKFENTNKKEGVFGFVNEVEVKTIKVDGAAYFNVRELSKALNAKIKTTSNKNYLRVDLTVPEK